MKVLDASMARPLEGGPTFSLGNRVFRLFWSASWLLLARWTPPPLHAWRCFVLRSFGAKVASSVRFHANVKVWLPANLELGPHAHVGRGVEIYNQGRITIGARAMISQRAHLCASTHDVSDIHFQLQLRPVVIGRHCWVAAEAFVGPGVTMQEGSVLGARGALFSDADRLGIYRGNPAVKVKQRRLQLPEH